MVTANQIILEAIIKQQWGLCVGWAGVGFEVRRSKDKEPLFWLQNSKQIK